LPREQTLNESAVAASSSGALAERNDVVPAKRPIKILDGNAALLGHLLEGLRPADRLLDVADALICEASEHDKGSHRSPPLWPPAQPSHKAYYELAPFGTSIAVSREAAPGAASSRLKPGRSLSDKLLDLHIEVRRAGLAPTLFALISANDGQPRPSRRSD
jgi:hypothetical protein